jgi:hypothetical protein
MTRIFTLADARDEKRNAELPALARAEAQLAEQRRIQSILDAHGEIGILMRKGGPVYYVNWPVYREARDPAALVGA